MFRTLTCLAILGVLFTPRFCHAGRTYSFPGLRWQGVAYFSGLQSYPSGYGGVRYGRYLFVTVQNIGTIPQTITVSGNLREARWWVNGMCGNADYTAGAVTFRNSDVRDWNNFASPYTPQLGATTISVSPFVLQEAGRPGSSRTIGFAIEYWGNGVNQACPLSPEGNLGITLSTTEDRGAVTATMSESCHSHGGSVLTNSSWNNLIATDLLCQRHALFNAGRPF